MPFLPSDISGLNLWLKADAGLTLNTTGYAGSGTVTQVGTAITGVGTAFTTEVVVGDALSGTNISGNVTVITDNTHITVDASNSGAGAAYTITPQAGVSDRISTWADQSTGTNSVTQGTAVRRPAKIPALKNSLPAVFMHNDNAALVAANTNSNIQTLFMVMRTVADLGGNRFLLYNADGTNSYRTVSPGKQNFVADSSISGTATLSANTWYITALTYSAPDVAFYLNGAADGTGTTTITGSIAPTRLGSTVAGGYFAEIIRYDSVLSAFNIARVFNYLNSRWAIYSPFVETGGASAPGAVGGAASISLIQTANALSADTFPWWLFPHEFDGLTREKVAIDPAARRYVDEKLLQMDDEEIAILTSILH